MCEHQEPTSQMSVFVMQKECVLSLWCCVRVEPLIIGMHIVSAILMHAQSKALNEHTLQRHLLYLALSSCTFLYSHKNSRYGEQMYIDLKANKQFSDPHSDSHFT